MGCKRGFDPSDTIQTARFGVQPLQKYVFRLDGVDRSAGEIQSSVEGDFLYVEKADFPVLLNYINTASLENQTIVARAGVAIAGPFKGLSLAHPLITGETAPNADWLVLLVGRGDGSVVNQFAFPIVGQFPSILVTTATAIQQAFSIAVPPGARFLAQLEVVLQATTVTQASWTASRNPAGNALALPAPRFGVYVQQNTVQGVFDTRATAYSPYVRLTDSNIPIPHGTQNIEVIIGGTGLALFTGNGAVKANFA